MLFAAAETTQRKQPEKSSGDVGAFFCTRMINLVQTEKLETYILLNVVVYTVDSGNSKLGFVTNFVY